jgi:hypothetical protein
LSGTIRVDHFGWSTFDALLPWSVTPSEAVISTGAWHMLANPATDDAVRTQVRDGVRQAIVDAAFSQAGAYGGEHSSFQIYPAWFSYTGGDGDHGNTQYNGRPSAVVEPLYPYYRDDAQTSTYGPAPGLVPGGPNYYSSGSYDIPNRSCPAYAYRDWSVGCDWTGSTCASSSWEITEPMIACQGLFVLLASFLMSGAE